MNGEGKDKTMGRSGKSSHPAPSRASNSAFRPNPTCGTFDAVSTPRSGTLDRDHHHNDDDDDDNNNTTSKTDSNLQYSPYPT
jgi:hypothetical protein